MTLDARIIDLRREMLVDGTWRKMETYAMALAHAGHESLVRLLQKEREAARQHARPIRQTSVNHRPRNFRGAWDVREYQMLPGEIIHGHPVFLSYGSDQVHTDNPDGVFVGFAYERRICLEGHDAHIQVKTPAGPDAEVESYFWPRLQQTDEGEQVIINSPLTMRTHSFSTGALPHGVAPIGTVASVTTSCQAWVHVREPEDGRR
jgi:hypothetical protein